jgi:hypothetical protein
MQWKHYCRAPQRILNQSNAPATISSSSSKRHLLHIDVDTAHHFLETCHIIQNELAAILQAVLYTSSSSDSSIISGHHQKGHRTKKSHKRGLSYETAIASPFNRKYLAIADQDPDPTSLMVSAMTVLPLA